MKIGFKNGQSEYRQKSIKSLDEIRAVDVEIGRFGNIWLGVQRNIGHIGVVLSCCGDIWFNDREFLGAIP